MQVATQHIHSIKEIANRIEAMRAQLASLVPAEAADSQLTATGVDSAPRALFPQHRARREGGASVAQDEPEMCGARVPPRMEMAARASAPVALPATSAPRVPPVSREVAPARSPRAGPTQPPSEAADSHWPGGPGIATAEAIFQAATEPPTAGPAENPTTAASTPQAAAAEPASASASASPASPAAAVAAPAAAPAAGAAVAGEPAVAEAADSVAAAPETCAAPETSAVAEVPAAQVHAAGGADDPPRPRRSRRAPAAAPLAAPAETPERQARAAATPQAAASHAAASSHAASSVVDEQPDNDDCCAVCLESEGFDDNPIVFCDGCNVCCHMDCYGLSEIPAGSW